MLPVATVEHYCWIVSSCQTYNSSLSARLSRQINYTERNKTWLFIRLSPTGPLSTHSPVVFDQRITEIPVLGFHLRANVHNEHLLLFCFRCFPELIQCFVLQHHYRLGFTTYCTMGKMEPAPHWIHQSFSGASDSRSMTYCSTPASGLFTPTTKITVSTCWHV